MNDPMSHSSHKMASEYDTKFFRDTVQLIARTSDMMNLDPNIKAFFIVNPGNPFAVALSSDTIKKIGAVLKKRPDLILLTDDVYGTFVPGEASLTYLGFFGGQGVTNGTFQYPNGVALDARGRIYVTDAGNDRVQVWSY